MAGFSRYLILPDPGAADNSPGLSAVEKVAPGLTQGRFSMVEHSLAPGLLAAPPHTHSREDEFSVVLSGQVGALMGEEEMRLPPGSVLIKPRGIRHTFWNAGAEPARLLEIISPAGFEAYFPALQAVLNRPDSQGRPDMGALMALAARFGLAFDMDALPSLLAKHSLRLA